MRSILRWRHRGTIALAWLAAMPAIAATYHVDDSLSLPSNPATTMRWKSAAPTRANADVVVGATTVTIRLNLAPWLNKSGRIYMALTQQPTLGQVKAQWTTQGRLLPGTVLSGERTLVYSGPIRSPLVEDTFIVSVEADGKRLASPQRLEFTFEIDAD